MRVSPRGKDELDELGRAFDRMVAELGETRSRLEYLQKVSAWQEVARRLAHEIKNPLTPIQLAVQELGSKYRGDDPATRACSTTAQEILKEEIDSMRRLVDDFSAFAKLPKVEPAPIDLGQVVEDFVRGHTEWQPHVRFDKPAAPVEALCDRMLIRRVLANLVENAVQAAEGAGRVPEVVLHVEADRGGDDDRGRIDIVVDDNGPGVPASARERIFDPYVTTKENGTGLGLAIVRKIVHRPRRRRGAWPPSRRRSAARASRSRSPPLRQQLRLRVARPRQCRTLRRLRDAVGEHGGGRRREPRLDAPAAHAAAQHALGVDGQRGRVERLLGAVGELQRDRAVARRGAARARRAACRRRRCRRSAARRGAGRTRPSGSSRSSQRNSAWRSPS